MKLTLTLPITLTLTLSSKNNTKITLTFQIIANINGFNILKIIINAIITVFKLYYN